VTTDLFREGERRYATVMFADVSGFTAMARTMDPEDVSDVMNGCFALLERAVVQYGGHVDKYIGDCIMALFGIPRAIEDAPRQAVNAAIAIRNDVATFTRERGLAALLDIHVGINTGLVVYGGVGGAERRDLTAMGDAVNVASRLRDVARPGTIYVGTQTYTETRYDFAYRPLPRVELRDVEKPFQVYEVLSQVPQTHRARHGRADPTLLPTMVGRDREFMALRQRARDLAGGRGGVVTIVGDAGVGKSRLIEEVGHLPELAGMTMLEGRSVWIGDSLSLHPFIDLLRTWAGILDADDDATARRKVAAAVSAAVPSTHAEVLPFIATLMGIRLLDADARRVEGIDQDGMEKLIAKSLRDLLEALARQRPLVLCFEDLHWADRSSVQLLLQLLSIARRAPVLYFLVMRPNYELTSQAILDATRAGFAADGLELRLGPLDDKDCVLLLRSLIRFDDLPHATRAAILGKADGNPFFIEEVVRSLIDVGAIERTAQGLRVTERIDEVEVPGTIRELVMARVDRLPGHVRELLQIASVIGRTFPTRLLESVVPDREQLAFGLAALQKRQLIEASASGGEAGYAFRHTLAHETVYESILRKTRRSLHAAVATAIESMFADRLSDFYGMLAYHFGRAEQLDKAAEYLMKAGDEAARSAASTEARQYFEDAARVYDALHGDRGDPDTRALLEKKIGLACLNKGDLPAALDHFDRALAHLGHQPLRSTPQIALHLVADLSAIVFHLYAGHARRTPRPASPRTVATTELLFHKGKAQSTSAPQGYVMSMLPAIRAVGTYDASCIAEACGVYAAGAALFAWSGTSFRLARRMARASERLVRTVPDLVTHHTMTFLTHYLEGNWDDAHTLAPTMVEDGLRYGLFWEINTYLGFECERLIHQGRFEEALRTIGQIADIGDAYGYHFSRTNEYAMRAFLLLEGQRLDEARTAVDRYYALCDEEALNLLALGTRAKVLLLAGDRAAAHTALDEGEDIAQRLGRQAAPYHVAPLLVSRFLSDLDTLDAARGAEAAGEVRHAARTARASGKRAVAIAAKIARERPESYRLMGRLHWLLGNPRRARDWWERGIAEAERLGARPELARLLLESGERLDEPGRVSRGRILDEALAAAWANCFEGPTGGARRWA